MGFHQKKRLNFGLHSDIHKLIFFKLGMLIETTELYILIPVWMNLIFIQGHICMKHFCVHFLANFLC